MIFLLVSAAKSNLSPRDVLDNAFAIALAVSTSDASFFCVGSATVPNSLPSLSVNFPPLFVIVTVAVVELLFLSNTVTEYVVLLPSVRPVTGSADVLIWATAAFFVVAPVAALLLTDTSTLFPDCEPSSNFIVLNSVVSEILVSSL